MRKTERTQTKLAVSALHTVHVSDSGEKALPCAVVLHGGPGSGCHPGYLRLFPSGRCRVILPDQRGSGQSEPLGLLEENTTEALLEDLETVRRHFAIEKWLLVGGSWGSTLALLYAQKHPERVLGLVLRSLFFGTDAELKRAFLSLPAVFYPEAFARFVALVDDMERSDVLSAWYRLLLDEDPEISRAASFVWHDYERCLSELVGTVPVFPPDLSPQNAPADRKTPRTPRVEAHYFSQHCFLEPNQILDGMDRMKDIPGIVVQSRYDLLCPPSNARRLLEKWPAGKKLDVESAGHSQSETGVADAMRAAIVELLG